MHSLTTATRLGAMLIDHVIMTFVAFVVLAPSMVYDMIQSFSDRNSQPELFLGNKYLGITVFALYFCKDVYQGRSPAKRILKLQVVVATSGEPANPLRCLVRNFTIFLWPIEAIVALINKERRIGDFIAGTKLVPYDPAQHKAVANWALIIIAFIIALIYTYFIAFYPIEVIREQPFMRV